jgi:hypothetical protein
MERGQPCTFTIREGGFRRVFLQACVRDAPHARPAQCIAHLLHMRD